MTSGVCCGFIAASISWAFAGNLADEKSADNAAAPAQHVGPAESIAYRWVFGDESDPVAASHISGWGPGSTARTRV